LRAHDDEEGDMSMQPMSKVHRWGIGVAVLVVGVIAAAAVTAAPADAEAHAVRHLRLVSTVPAADAVLSGPPAEVRAVFSEEPGSVSLRLSGAGDVLVPTTEAAPDPADAKVSFIRPEKALEAGEYTVRWRVVARDGHAQNGTFEFRVVAD
jgi:methionine-rich copper-binding protein CopC